VIAIETFLRGGALALLALLAIAGLRARHVPGERYSVPFDLCAIAYLLETAPGLRDSHAWWVVPLRVLSNTTPAVFELWTQASFTESFAARRWRFLPSVAMLALATAAVLTDARPIWLLLRIAAFLLVGTGVWRTLAGWRGDLVESRRWARLVFAFGVGLWIAVVTVLSLAGVGIVPAVGGVLGIALVAALLRLRSAEAPAAAPAGRAWPAPQDAAEAGEPMDDAERRLHDRLLALFEVELVHREGGLTPAGLAQRLGVAEYRLRRLINRRLGHRNFTEFLNTYRLAEARAALADPAQARVPVLTIALDAGFQSIGPFNRAFKAATGETPTEYRRRLLGGEEAASA
jgi:AraC-like DNA-binding protein